MRCEMCGVGYDTKSSLCPACWDVVERQCELDTHCVHCTGDRLWCHACASRHEDPHFGCGLGVLWEAGSDSGE